MSHPEGHGDPERSGPDALVEALARELGERAVTRTDAGDPDPRTAAHLSGRDVGRPMCWVRPSGTDEVVTVVRRCAAAGVKVVPVGAATAYWDPLRLAGAVALDTRALSAPLTVDAVARTAQAGAGVSLRALDRLARQHGLCLAARPDAGGDTPVGALYAVGSTAGLGLGLCAPIEQIAGATVVSGRGEVLRLGASHALFGQPFQRHGAPEALGLFAAAEGAGAIVTEVGLQLHPAPHIATLRARGRAPLEKLLACARAALDAGQLESYRIELVNDALALFARTLGRSHPREALDGARALAAAWRSAGLEVGEPEPEPEAARRGEDPAYEYHWAFPEGEHRARLLGGALWGVEVGASWSAVEAVASGLGKLHRELGALAKSGLLQRRLAIYPAPHAVTVGVQAIVRRPAHPPARPPAHPPAHPNDGSLEPLLALLEGALPDLLELGAVPYRRGHLWRAALARHGAPDLARSLLAELDPSGVLPEAAPSPRPDHPFLSARGEDAPCLSREQRPRPPALLPRPLPPLLPPPPPALLPRPLPPLPAPCDECALAAACALAALPASGPRPLRPLRHAEPLAAALAATRAIAAAWDRPPPAALEALLVELTASRLGPSSLPPPPFELSLKIAGDRLLPVLRVVEYSATGALRLERGRARRRLLTQLVTRLRPEAPWEEWLERVETHQPPGLELSLGLEARLDADAIAPQLYAHIDPGDRAAMHHLARALAPGARLDELLGLPLERPVELVLAALAPRPEDPRAGKLYLSTPLALAHPPSGLAPAALGPLAPYAPPHGLAVLEHDAAGARFRKHDFPCAVHFQRAGDLPLHIGAGLVPDDARRLTRLLDGKAFAPWPTWLSVSPAGRALYFIPR